MVHIIMFQILHLRSQFLGILAKIYVISLQVCGEKEGAPPKIEGEPTSCGLALRWCLRTSSAKLYLPISHALIAPLAGLARPQSHRCNLCEFRSVSEVTNRR